MGATSQTTRVRFTHPALPEIKLCYAVVLGGLIYGVSCIWIASRNFKWGIGDFGVYSYLPFYGSVIKDHTNWEWINWSPFAWHYLPVLIVHTLLFNLGSKHVAETPFVVTYTLLSIAACVYYFTPLLVIISAYTGHTNVPSVSLFQKQGARLDLITSPSLLYNAQNNGYYR
ncbi:hypothetical protein KIN20_023431 [Parelaphostrongylus tenuis]|uniref:Uncharacterized protein n=1 Tax=Parelaphostrongylus tenuis TaxID=148309 RepID=A0AAD5N920_PARTN|nr:hypothetical protein KIN20_023431 [Parelaphostrongylus tenuis]